MHKRTQFRQLFKKKKTQKKLDEGHWIHATRKKREIKIGVVIKITNYINELIQTQQYRLHDKFNTN